MSRRDTYRADYRGLSLATDNFVDRDKSGDLGSRLPQLICARVARDKEVDDLFKGPKQGARVKRGDASCAGRVRSATSKSARRLCARSCRF